MLNVDGVVVGGGSKAVDRAKMGLTREAYSGFPLVNYIIPSFT